MTFVTSSYCTNDGCVEMEYVKSSHSGPSGCVEMAFVTSSHCTQGDCVEVGRDGGEYRLRDSKNPDGPHLTFTPAAMTAFLAGVKAGTFDQL